MLYLKLVSLIGIPLTWTRVLIMESFKFLPFGPPALILVKVNSGEVIVSSTVLITLPHS